MQISGTTIQQHQAQEQNNTFDPMTIIFHDPPEAHWQEMRDQEIQKRETLCPLHREAHIRQMITIQSYILKEETETHGLNKWRSDGLTPFPTR